jgi:hypothetical protein
MVTSDTAERPQSIRLSFRPSARELALICALAAVITTWIGWGAFDPLPLIEDEISYVLQSRIFAGGNWTAPAPPLPDFFQQPHVLTSPAVASKYFPGTALLFSLGSLLGATFLVPLLLRGLTAALLFLLVRRVANTPVGLLSVVIWLGDPISLRFGASYFSQNVTTALWFVSWWALLEWRESRRRRWLLALAVAIGWGAITRPLTMLAFAVPVGIVVAPDAVRLRAWKDFGLAIGVGIAILAIIPLWSARTTGDWRLTPQTLYTQRYLPFDRPGFGVDAAPPKVPLNPVNLFTYSEFFMEHVNHTPARLPVTIVNRLAAIARQEWKNERLLLVPFVLAGLTVAGAPVLFALACSIALFLAYLSYGHWAEWTLYQFEALPVLSVLAALGIWRALGLIRANRRPVAVGVAVAVLGIIAVDRLRVAREERVRLAAWDTSFREALNHLPVRNAVIFVRYAPGLRPHARVVANSPNLEEDRFWIVNDLGERNRELMPYVESRVPLIFHEDGGRFEVDRRLLRR